MTLVGSRQEQTYAVVLAVACTIAMFVSLGWRLLFDGFSKEHR